MEEKIKKVLSILKEKGVDYADIRIVDTIKEKISTENLKVQDLENSRSKGAGIRVILDGSLGFASTQNFEQLEETALKALEIAKSSRLLQREKIKLAPKEVVVDHYETKIEIDPFTVSKSEKIKLLFDAEKAMRKSAKLIRTNATMDFQKQEKIFADTEGSYITQLLYESGGGIVATARNNGITEIRSYPNSFRGNHGTAGYEYVLKLDLVGHAEKIAKEAVMLTHAEECPSGYYDIILDGGQLALQIHESIGHPIELDRVFGSEAAYAGMSFLGVEMMDNFKYGSEHVTVVMDATIPTALGTYGYDDDGVKATREVIIEKGIFKNFISSRDTAVKIGRMSNGNNRADEWWNIPIVRMSNISLMPGDFEFDELVKGIEYGFYMVTNKSWSIDDKRLNFQFACEIAYEIKNGEFTGKIYRNPIYTGITPQFWRSCDGVCNKKYWKVYGTPNCGKGQPPQTAHVAHGASPARFRKVKVGVKDVK
ncbi:TldD/PmbA family protein [Caloranaerobacter sp. DY30410]|uniref:TldD/PmbA family protein n=1 Tax=Caloranaerobacter sp. DY30410 TaxID=3238305 RepID=UPI003D022E8D